MLIASNEGGGRRSTQDWHQQRYCQSSCRASKVSAASHLRCGGPLVLQLMHLLLPDRTGQIRVVWRGNIQAPLEMACMRAGHWQDRRCVLLEPRGCKRLSRRWNTHPSPDLLMQQPASAQCAVSLSSYWHLCQWKEMCSCSLHQSVLLSD